MPLTFFTKYLKPDDLERLLKDMNVFIMEGRSDMALKVNSVGLDSEGSVEWWYKNQRVEHCYVCNMVKPDTHEMIDLDVDSTIRLEDFVSDNS